MDPEPPVHLHDQVQFLIRKARRIGEPFSLPDSQSSSDLERRGFLDAVQAAEGLDGRAVLLGDLSEGVAGADGVVLAGRLLGRGAGCGFLLGLLFGEEAFFFVGTARIMPLSVPRDSPLKDRFMCGGIRSLVGMQRQNQLQFT